MAEHSFPVLHSISVSAMDNNCYLLTCRGEGLLIDAADDAPAIMALIAKHGVTLTALVTTHRHWDHVRATEAVLLRFPTAHHYAARKDADALPVPAQPTDQGDTIFWAGLPLQCIVLRGHTPGGLALVVPREDGVTQIFTGDSLFPGGVGKTTSPEEFAQLYHDVVERIFAVYPDSTVIYPGHGRPTTLGEERPFLATWRERGW